MSQMIARQVMDRLHQRQSLISMTHADSVAADLRQLSAADPKVENAAFEERKGDMLAAYGFAQNQERKPFAFSNGIAIIPVHGSLINRFGASWGYVTGYNFIQAQMNAALVDDDVKGIIFDMNSYGGEAAGCFELAEHMFEMRGKKPTLAVVDSNCYSACYALASAADKIVVTPTGGAGSIGVVAMHMSMEKMLESWGIKVSFIYAGAHKVDGNPFEDLPDDVRADIQRGVDTSYEKFVSTVARNRGLDAEAVRKTEARVYRAEEAQSLGLIDAVDSPSKAVAAFFNELSGSQTEQENIMTDEEKAQLQADAKAEARKEEQTRVSGIVNCEEAKGNESLANHLAFNTQLSVDEAKQMLSASKPAQAAAPAKVEGKKADKSNQFQEHMDADDQPNLDAGGKESGKQDEQSKGAGILADCKAAGLVL